MSPSSSELALIPPLHIRVSSHRGDVRCYLHGGAAEQVRWLLQAPAFGDCGGLVLDEAVAGVENGRDRLLRALAHPEANQRILDSQAMIKCLWQVDRSRGPYPLLDVLADFQTGHAYYRAYRDHLVHQVRVWVLGLYLLSRMPQLLAAISDEVSAEDEWIAASRNEVVVEALRRWQVTALWHDLGYVFEVQAAARPQQLMKRISNALLDAYGTPLAGLLGSSVISADQERLWQASAGGLGGRPVAGLAGECESLVSTVCWFEEPDSEWIDPVIGMSFRYVPAGSFMMGSPRNENGRQEDELQHRVTISKGFWLAENEVTQSQWCQVFDTNPSYFSNCGDNCPVESVSWYEAIYFTNQFSRRLHLDECYELYGCQGILGSGCPNDTHSCISAYTCHEVAIKKMCNGFRLPTEAEWEYATRANTTTKWSYGDDEENLIHFAWFSRNSGRTTYPVATLGANRWGLHDMHGNVLEWCWDLHGSYDLDEQKDPVGPSIGTARVLRGGAFFNWSWFLRSAFRFKVQPDVRCRGFGFRCVLSAIPTCANLQSRHESPRVFLSP